MRLHKGRASPMEGRYLSWTLIGPIVIIIAQCPLQFSNVGLARYPKLPLVVDGLANRVNRD